jgi:NAD(P)-dependent dehydrogenase (short-subunit alcohol dehydrogenase family)
MELNGNTILITGGSGGIGLALAKKFVELVASPDCHLDQQRRCSRSLWPQLRRRADF